MIANYTLDDTFDDSNVSSCTMLNRNKKLKNTDVTVQCIRNNLQQLTSFDNLVNKSPPLRNSNIR